MIILAVSFIIGIAVFNFFSFFPVSIITLCIAAGISLFIRSENTKKTLLIIFVFVSGFFYSLIRHETFPEMSFADKEVSVEGNIINVPEMINGKIRFTVDQVLIDGKEIRGKVMLSLSEESIINKSYMVKSGHRINAVTKLRAPNVFHNPGIQAYDLKKDGIVAVGYSKEIHVIGKNKNPWIWIQNRRHLLGNVIDRSLSSETAALHKAIILGLTGGIDQGMRDAFSVTGLAHILSISGTHFGLLAFMIFKLIKMTVKFLPEKYFRHMTMNITPSQVAVLITLPVLVFYAFISGMSTPAVRSLIMIFIYMLALFLGRRDQWLNSLAIAAFIILIYKPSALFDISFQLSFMAVLTIGYVAERRAKERGQGSAGSRQESVVSSQDKADEQPVKRIFDKTKTAIFMTVAAVLGTAPIVALVFKQFPLISPVTNLIVTPYICFVVLPLGFFASFNALIFQMTTIPFNGLIDMVTHFSLQIIKMFSQIPYSNIHIPSPSFVIIILYYFSLMFLLKASYRRVVIIIPLVLIICIYLITPSFRGNKLKITFLDVGQGDSSVVELPDKKVMLIDGGMYEPDMGRAVIAPYLWSRGVRSIDYLVLTHPHPDHYGGLIYIMENFRIGEVWLNGRKTTEAEKFFQKIKEMKIYYRVLRRGDVLDADKYKIYVFHPYDEFFADSQRGAFSNENSASMVLKYESDNISVLFTGDIETEAEESLTPLGKPLKSDIIKVPHHGGRTSSSAGFIKTVNPQIAVISAGKNNSFNHPHKETIDRYKAAGVRIYRTDIDGAITIFPVRTGFKPDPPYEVQTYWDTEFKKVITWRDEARNLRLLF
jgi:competence protein ComEC